MEKEIVKQAISLFLQYGFKSVTMDDIAQHMGVSKKTIYVHFPKKEQLVLESSMNHFDLIIERIISILKHSKDPIIELYQLKKEAMNYLSNEKKSPQYQLQKYYPKIFKNLKLKQFDVMHGLIKENLMKGIKQNLYRKTIDIDFIGRIYFQGMTGIKNKDLFPLNNYSMLTLTNYHLEYHLRGICTSKGLEELNKQLSN